MLKKILFAASVWGFLSVGCQTSFTKPDGIPTQERIKSLNEACESRHGPSCYTLGYIYEFGQGVAESKILSKAYYKNACNLGVSAACKDPYTDPTKKPPLTAGLREEEQEALRACDSGDKSACERVNDYGVRHLKEETNLKLAVELWLHACKKGIGTACANIGISVEPSDPKFALEFHKLACESRNGGGCLRAAQILVKSDNPALAIQYFDKACDAEVAEGCQVTAAIMQNLCDEKNVAPACAAYAGILIQGKKGVDADSVKSKQYARRACRMGSKEGCELERFTP